MPFCAAYGCKNSSKDCKTNNVSFHKIPKQDDLRRKQWIKNLRRQGDLPKDSGFYVCSEHFTADCFKKDYRVRNLIFLTFVYKTY